jgi:tRNA pseudouridine55 synthase
VLASHETARRLSSGLLYVDKPVGMSSHDVVAVVRRAARTRRVGHAGTLDPFATGLLVLAVGPCTRLLPYIVGDPKIYDAEIRFGTETDTDDATGTATVSAPLPANGLLSLALDPVRLAAEALLTGTLAQIPPSYSAKHVDGQRAYDLARKGRDVSLAPVSVRVDSWEWRGGNRDTLHTRITCGGGTYIRALARDLGRALGSAAHCGTLRRMASGPATVDQAVTLDQLAPGALVEGTIQLQSPLPLLGNVAHEELSDEQLTDLRHGREVSASQPGAWAALLRDGVVVAMAERSPRNRWQPRVVLLGDPA